MTRVQVQAIGVLQDIINVEKRKAYENASNGVTSISHDDYVKRANGENFFTEPVTEDVRQEWLDRVAARKKLNEEAVAQQNEEKRLRDAGIFA